MNDNDGWLKPKTRRDWFWGLKIVLFPIAVLVLVWWAAHSMGFGP